MECNGCVGLAIGGNIEASVSMQNIRPKSDISYTSFTGLLQRMSILNPPCSTACFLTVCISLRDNLPIHEELSQVKKMFPQLKLFGYFGFGEIAGKNKGDTKQGNVLHFNSVVLSIVKLL